MAEGFPDRKSILEYFLINQFGEQKYLRNILNVTF